jgi:hypothetical protein
MDVPEPVMLVGVMVPQVSPEGTVSERLTIPPKWFTAVTVTVEFVELPALAGAGVAEAIVKSRNWKVAVELWTRGELVPMIVAV